MIDEALPRGIRLCNPFNIRKTGTEWRGEVAGRDDAFETFATAQLGIRAGCKLLLNYQRLYNLDTVDLIIGRFAPPVENDTGAYAADVARRMSILRNGHINLRHRPTLRLMAQAIIAHENRNYAYPDDVLDRGIDMALEG